VVSSIFVNCSIFVLIAIVLSSVGICGARHRLLSAFVWLLFDDNKINMARKAGNLDVEGKFGRMHRGR